MLLHMADEKKKGKADISLSDPLSSSAALAFDDKKKKKTADMLIHALGACAEVYHSYISTTTIFNIYSGGCTYLFCVLFLKKKKAALY